ncbi:hypothetical protein JL721_310 [Aureococcus anophagefferens]|nr:hypothetical protein JL721_310 [Aureococcus anophagefferens]
MLLLFETAAGHALYELKNAAKLQGLDIAKVGEKFATEAGCEKNLALKAFAPFRDTAEAVAAATEHVESKLGKPLKKFLKKHVGDKALSVELGVADAKFGSLIKDKLGIPCAANAFVNECLRGVRSLRRDAGRAVGLLDDLDKEVNTYAMRVKEWYGWHFPEMAKLVNDNVHYAKIVREVRARTAAKDKVDELTEILDDEVAAKTLVATAEISMGTEVDESDMEHICNLAVQVVELSAYRQRLADYLRSRMQAIAPNLTTLVGELVGARLVQHAGSIMNLAKHPASTIQILGPEKALFRALKTKHDTPKYGLIYHASLIGQAAPKHKGKIARVLAAKCALAVRDAGGRGRRRDDRLRAPGRGAPPPARGRQRRRRAGDERRAEEARRGPRRAAGAAGYSAASDMVLDDKKAKKEKKKRKKAEADDDDDDDEAAAAKKAKKAAKKAKRESEGDEEKPKKKKKKSKDE